MVQLNRGSEKIYQLVGYLIILRDAPETANISHLPIEPLFKAQIRTKICQAIARATQ